MVLQRKSRGLRQLPDRGVAAPGMVLNVALIFRQVGGIEPEGDPIELVYQVLTLARIYEDAASKVWPARKPGLIEFAKRFAARWIGLAIEP